MTKASTQLLVRNIELTLKRRLKRRAERNGHSMEQEVRNILRNALKEEEKPQKGLGTRLAERFEGLGITEEIPQLKIKLRVPKFD
jgi:plasmid stability protein